MPLPRLTQLKKAAKLLTGGQQPVLTTSTPVVPQDWKPHGYQLKAVEFLLNQRAAGLFLDPGLGKTSITLKALDVLLQERMLQRTLVIAPLRPCYMVWPEQIDGWKQFSHLRYSILHGNHKEQALEQDADVYIINPEGLPWLMANNRLRNLEVRGLVVDECFAGDTLISTEHGAVKISMLKVGTKVYTDNGLQAVQRISCRTPIGNTVHIRTSNGKTISCTEEHTFFTEIGWLPAKYIAGRRLLCLAEVSSMQRQLQNSATSIYTLPQSTDLLQVLRYETELDVPQSSTVAEESFHHNEEQPEELGSVEHGCTVEQGSKSQASSYTEKQGTSTMERATGWQRADSKGGAVGACSAATEVYFQLCNKVGEQAARLSYKLQSRFWQSYCEGSVGNRRQQSQEPTAASARYEEGNQVEGTWVDSVTYEERGSVPLVWNLEVENCPHFEVEGIALVHNSSKFKHTRTQRFKMLKPALPTFDYRFILTGSPNPNGYLDLFGQVYILDMGAALGSYITHYRTTYFVPSGYGGYTWKLQEGGEDRIHKKLKPLVLRLDAADYIKMPKLMPNVIRVDLPAKARKVYDELEDGMITELDSGSVVTAPNSGSALNKCCQVASGALYHMLDPTMPKERVRKWELVHDAKIEALQDLIDELQGSPLLLAYEYHHDLTRILQLLGKDAPYLGSGVSMEASRHIEKQWNNDQIAVLPGHPASMGHGLNLQRGTCHHVAFFTQTWDFELYDQFIRRVRRQGNSNAAVFVHHIIARKTVDEAKFAKLKRKAKTQQGLLDALRSYVKGKR